MYYLWPQKITHQEHRSDGSSYTDKEVLEETIEGILLDKKAKDSKCRYTTKQHREH
jgi:hypothetical protein